MLECGQTFETDTNNPTNELLVRILRLSAVPWLIVGLVLYLTGVLEFLPALSFLFVAVIDVFVVPTALRNLPGKIMIDTTGLTMPARRGQLMIPWTDVDTIEVRSDRGQSLGWLYDLLGVDTSGEFVFVGVRPDSETRRKSQYLKQLTLYMKEPGQFVDAANDLRSA